MGRIKPHFPPLSVFHTTGDAASALEEIPSAHLLTPPKNGGRGLQLQACAGAIQPSRCLGDPSPVADIVLFCSVLPLKAFLGGLDLCFGRWDSKDHPVVDDNHLAPLHPGKDYFNPDVCAA